MKRDSKKKLAAKDQMSLFPWLPLNIGKRELLQDLSIQVVKAKH